jgi:hypothetical protein
MAPMGAARQCDRGTELAKERSLQAHAERIGVPYVRAHHNAPRGMARLPGIVPLPFTRKLFDAVGGYTEHDRRQAVWLVDSLILTIPTYRRETSTSSW